MGLRAVEEVRFVRGKARISRWCEAKHRVIEWVSRSPSRVVYAGSMPNDNITHMFKVSIDGGPPVELGRGNLSSGVVSPDGTRVAYRKTEGQGASTKVKVV